jgi:sulfite exporter TauE/SafE
LGTFPAMLMMGGVGRAVGPSWRHRGVHLAASFILVFGLITVGRALLPLVGHGHNL